MDNSDKVISRTTTTTLKGEEGFPDRTVCTMENIYETVYARASKTAKAHGYVLPVVGNEGEAPFIITKIIQKPTQKKLTNECVD